MNTAIQYKEYYLQFPEALVRKYPELNFENHCYLRIALDNVVGTKWDKRIAKPAYKHLNTRQRALVIEYLSNYLDDKALLQSHHMISMAYRGKLV
ncbi:acetyltransferase [Dokdonia sp. Hel_I_53]|uniref:acetyltransferase n=1 Tax=Dokdonia sp. Hel_I_53 TaxID=1566287 RepID=UPI0011990C07|nr:acetyltransferase [Dokdonia sp. Hel_I_53]TVZ51432.1 hypothetical protein OD90_0574 [Dokdonia sp. Hel_I_53]